MNKKNLIVFFISIIAVLCAAYLIAMVLNKKEEPVAERQVNVVNYKFGDLKLKIIDTLKDQNLKNPNYKIFSIVNDKEDVTLTMLKEENVTVSVEDYINNFDLWSPNLSNMDQININDVDWYFENKDYEFTWITKHNNDIYAIKVYYREDPELLTAKLKEAIETSLSFE